MFTDCHPSANTRQDKGKLSAAGLSNPVHTNTGQQANNKTDDAQLLLEVENQLVQDGGNWDYNELKISCQNCDRGRTGFIGNKEVCGLPIIFLSCGMFSKIVPHEESLQI